MYRSKKILNDEFLRRRAIDTKYSLRDFARSLGVPSGRLSELLSGKRRVTPKMAQKLFATMALSPTDQLVLMQDIRKKSGPATKAAAYVLREEQFSMISDPLHFSLLTLMDTDDFRNDIPWIAKRLQTTTAEIRTVIDRLLLLGLISESDSLLIKTHKDITTTHDIGSAALRLSHAKTLDHAKAAQQLLSPALRDISSICIAMDANRLPEAKKKIIAFRREMAQLLETGKRNAVFNLNIQLVPVTRENL